MHEPLTNDIPAQQLRPELVALMRARHRAYRDAKLTQGIFVSLTIVLPIVSVLLSPSYPQLKGYLALVALVLSLLDIGIVDRFQKDRIKRGAKLQEEFDIRVFGLPWKRFVAGSVVDPEDVRAASAKPLSPTREATLTPWYEPCVGEIPLSLGRLICQRTNISYDTRLRARYGAFLLYSAITLGIALLFVGLVLKLDFSEMILTVLVPSTPLLGWALREHTKQAETVSGLENLKTEVGKLWEEALAGAHPAELELGSRGLQDALYRHRASSPLVFDWAYDLLRNGNEDAAAHAAQHFVTQAKAVLNTKVVA